MLQGRSITFQKGKRWTVGEMDGLHYDMHAWRCTVYKICTYTCVREGERKKERKRKGDGSSLFSFGLLCYASG